MEFPRFTGEEPCTQIGVENFFMDPTHFGIWAAKNIQPICAACPMQAECLEWGLRHEEHGWWGGYSPRERHDMRRRRGVELKTIPSTYWAGAA